MTELTSFGKGGHYPGEWYSLHNIATDSKGNLYTVETYQGRRAAALPLQGPGAGASTADRRGLADDGPVVDRRVRIGSSGIARAPRWTRTASTVVFFCPLKLAVSGERLASWMVSGRCRQWRSCCGRPWRWCGATSRADASSGEPRAEAGGRRRASAESPVIDGMLDEAVWQQARTDRRLRADGADRRSAGDRADRGPHPATTTDASTSASSASTADPSRIVTTDSRRDSGLTRQGLVPDDLRHLPRSAERVHLRHQRRRHRVRRAGAQRRRDAARRRRPAASAAATPAASGAGVNVNWDGAWEVKTQRHRDRLDGRVRHSAAHAALRSAAADLGRQLLAEHPAQARAGVLVADVAHLQPDAPVVGRRAARAGTCRRRATSS